MITIKIHKDLHAALKREAERRECTLQVLIDQVLFQFIENETPESIKDI